jgi:uncharacterized protein YndB with AHSA1/START domain
MKITVQTTNPLTDDSARTATGRTLPEWFDHFDAWNAKEKGRRELGVYLYHNLKQDTWWSSTLTVEYEAARDIREKDGRLRGYMICVTKTIATSTGRVFAAWTSAEALESWMGSGTAATVKDGGSFSNSDGNRGEFRRVRTDKDLRFIWNDPACAPGTIVDVTFQSKGDCKCLMMLSHDRIQTRAEADGLRDAWGEAFDRLKLKLES